jgi:hypothetical protein
MHKKHTWRTQRQNKEMGKSKKNVRKISLKLCNITSLVLKMWQEETHGKRNKNISAIFVTANMSNGYVLLK